MHTLHNLPTENAELKTALEELNSLVQKDSDAAHYVVQWIVNNSTQKELSYLVKSLKNKVM